MRILLIAFSIILSKALIAQDYPSVLADKECIVLDLSESVEEKNSHFVYKWDFGDGSFAYGITAEHCYNDIGIFDATLSILDPISSKNFEEEYSQTIQIKPAVELEVEMNKKSDLYSFTAKLQGFDNDAQFYWSYGDEYVIAKEIANIRLQSGEKLRVLARFNFQGEETFLAKEIEITENL